MKRIFKTLLLFCCLFLAVFSCTKDVGLITEVEFQFIEEHSAEGFINQKISTSFTVIPEELLEDYKYNISYKVLQGDGYFEDLEGGRWDSGNDRTLTVPSPLTTNIQYVGIVPGEHILNVTAIDNFGFTKELEVKFNIINLEVIWEVNSEISEIQLNRSVAISLVFDIVNATPDTTYESRLELVSGSGILNPAIEGGYVIETNYTPIITDTYSFDYTPSALGSHQLNFILRDSNGLEINQELNFDVVNSVEVISVSFGNNDMLEMILGDELVPTITFDPVNATNLDVSLVSGNVTIIEIGENNVIRAVGLGTTEVTVISASKPEATDTITITVVEPEEVAVTEIIVSQENPNNQNAIRQLIAAILPTDVTNNEITWSSNNPQIATIDENGLLMGLSAGEVMITATSVSNPDITGMLLVEITEISLQSDNDIIAFELSDQVNSDIDFETHTITVTVKEGSPLIVTPSVFNISDGATVSPGVGQILDFNDVVEYNITSGSGIEQLWTIVIEERPNVLFSIEGGDFNRNALFVDDVSRQWSGSVIVYEATNLLVSALGVGTNTTFEIDGEEYSVSATSFFGDAETIQTMILPPGTYAYQFTVIISSGGVIDTVGSVREF